jgi:hypothetical protein
MVSSDHFRQELLAQMGRAAKSGLIDSLINSAELYRPLGGKTNVKGLVDVLKLSDDFLGHNFGVRL